MAKKTSANTTSESFSFEEALQRLEEIVRTMEEGRIGLNESLERYEEGVQLLRHSFDLLQRAERKIELLSGIDPDGNPITQPFDATATMDSNESGTGRTRRRSSPTAPPERKRGSLFEDDSGAADEEL
jgi:exodeoxyribonuclease VII small subunit